MDFSTERQSMDFIHRVGEYRTLVGKRDQLGYPLGSLEQARLDELEAFFARQVDKMTPAAPALAPATR